MYFRRVRPLQALERCRVPAADLERDGPIALANPLHLEGCDHVTCCFVDRHLPTLHLELKVNGVASGDLSSLVPLYRLCTLCLC